jgi:hypothetical protein
MQLRVSRDAEIVGADFIVSSRLYPPVSFVSILTRPPQYHQGNAFELTSNQVKLYNQEKNAQHRILRRRAAAARGARTDMEGAGGVGGAADEEGGGMEMVETTGAGARL